MNKTKEHYHSLLKVSTFRVSPSSGKITKLSQKKSHLRKNEKGTCQSTSIHASQLVKKKKKNGMKKYTQSKHQSKKSANQKTIKQQKPFHRKMENSMLKKTQEAKNGRGSGHHEITSSIMAPRKKQPPRSPRPRTKKTVYEKCRSRGSQIGFKSLPFWMLQVFSTIAIYMASFFNLLPQWVSLHSTSALSKSNR